MQCLLPRGQEPAILTGHTSANPLTCYCCTLPLQPAQSLEGLWNNELKKIVGGGLDSSNAAAPRLLVPAEEKQPIKSTEEPSKAGASAPEPKPNAKPVRHHKEGEMQVEPEVLLKRGGKYTSKYAEGSNNYRIIDEDEETEEADKDSYNKYSSRKVGLAKPTPGRGQLLMLGRGACCSCVFRVLRVQLPSSIKVNPCTH